VATPSLHDRLSGVLLGTAVGDALGLPMEGMSARAVARAFPRLDRYFLLGRTGFVSDDTEQTALVAQSLARHSASRERCVRAFRRALLAWFLRLPWGIGFGTLRACLRIALGLAKTGVASAGNGAAMRAAVVGVFFRDDPVARRAFTEDLARVTHTDPRAVAGAHFVAELAARAALHDEAEGRGEIVEAALGAIAEPSLRDAIERARQVAADGVSVETASRTLGSSGYVVHSVAIAVFTFLRFGHDPGLAIAETVRAGGDTDSNAAIVGAWTGALHGQSALPSHLIADLHDGPFGPAHLRALAADLESARRGEVGSRAGYSWLGALARNLALYPVVLVHAFGVLFRR
jgi:ADP-ribosylglycohydrolase